MKKSDNKKNNRYVAAALSLLCALSFSTSVMPARAQLETNIGGSKIPAAQALFESSKAKGTAGDYVGQASDLTKALAIDPNYGKAFANRGCARFNMRDYRGSIEDIDKALKWYPHLQSIIDVRARAQAALDHPESIASGGGGGGGGGGGSTQAQRLQQAREIVDQAKFAPYNPADSASTIMHMAGIVAAGRRADAILHPENLQVASNSSGPSVSGKDNPFGGAATPNGAFSAKKNDAFSVKKTGATPQLAGASGDSPFSGQTGNALHASDSVSTAVGTSGDSPFGGQIGGNPFGGAPPANTSASSGMSAAEYFKQGCQKNQAQDFIGGLELLNHAVELDPNNGDAWVNRDLAKFHLQDVKGALSDFEEGKERVPNNKQLDQLIDLAKSLVGR